MVKAPTTSGATMQRLPAPSSSTSPILNAQGAIDQPNHRRLGSYRSLVEYGPGKNSEVPRVAG